MALWNEVENQNRLKALWTEIARRYKDEIAIGGFDLLNEPYVPEKPTLEATFAQWQNLAQDITDSIRTVDQNHLIIVEKLQNCKFIEPGKYWEENMNGDMNFFLIDDPNVAYEFHDYTPFKFTAQGAEWVPGHEGVYAAYPDENKVEIKGQRTWEGATFSNPKLDRNNGDWQELKGEKFKVTNPNFKVGMATLQAYKIGSAGKVWVDDITVKEYDEDGNFVRQISAYDFSQNSYWWYYCMDGSGSAAYTTREGHRANGSYMLSGATEDANICDGDGVFPIKQGYHYEISGWVKGANIDPDAIVKLRVDFSNAEEVNLMNKEYLERTLVKYLTFGQEHNVPMYLGEFGVICYGFEEDRGGERWVADFLDICKRYNINFNYHTYHENAYGLYGNSEFSYPANRNDALFEVFRGALSD
jgi:endoglucanase